MEANASTIQKTTVIMSGLPKVHAMADKTERVSCERLSNEGRKNKKPDPMSEAPQKRYSKAPPSQHCHICGRSSRNQFGHCSNFKLSLCRKSICEKCLMINEPDSCLEALDSDSDWKCTHCRDSCPSWARCRTYKRNNEKRRERKLKERAEKDNGKTVCLQGAAAVAAAAAAAANTVMAVNADDMNSERNTVEGAGPSDVVQEVQNQRDDMNPANRNDLMKQGGSSDMQFKEKSVVTKHISSLPMKKRWHDVGNDETRLRRRLGDYQSVEFLVTVSMPEGTDARQSQTSRRITVAPLPLTENSGKQQLEGSPCRSSIGCECPSQTETMSSCDMQSATLRRKDK